ncbi:acetylornithine deacetylase [Mycolicibacterium sp. Dal123E01]|uniref:acetylornithine deacetylase n=1 Tax=Mycolicibacterium sp. Dal123E01 TaxID=3457578 RepID=UPI00403EF3C9
MSVDESGGGPRIVVAEPRPPRSVELIEALVAVDTVSRHSNLPLIDTVRQLLDSQGVPSHLCLSPSGDKANLLATLPGARGRLSGGVMLSGHTDVVPVEGQDWDSAPFVPEVKDDRLFGRGTCDMKGFLGVVLDAVPDLLAAQLDFPVHLAFSYDEEVGMGGGRDLVEEVVRRDMRPAICIVGEPTDMNVVGGHKSLNLGRIEVAGRALHSSLAPLAVNAIDYAGRMVGFLADLAADFAERGPRDHAYEVPFSTLSVNVIDGGVAINTVAERCVVQFDYRTVGADLPELIMQQIAQRCAELNRIPTPTGGYAHLTLSMMAMVPGLDTAPTSPAVRVATALGGRPSSAGVGFCTEAGLFMRQGIETVVCGPGSIKQAHAPNEYVELDQIRACERFVGALATLDPATLAVS